MAFKLVRPLLLRTKFGLLSILLTALNPIPLVGQTQLREGQARQSDPDATSNMKVTLDSNAPSPFQGSWAAGLGGETRRDSASRQRTLSRGRFEFDLSYQVAPFLFLKAEPFVGFSNGFTQNDSLESSRSSGVEINEASINLGNRTPKVKGRKAGAPLARPKNNGNNSASMLSQFEYNLALGSLNQAFIDPMILDEVSFTAGRAETIVGVTNKWRLTAQHAIPPVESVSNNSRDLDKTPGFSSFTTDFHFGKIVDEKYRNRWITQPGSPSSLQMGAGYMQFTDLPFTLSSRSVLVGNTALSENPNSSGARFLNEEFRITIFRARSLVYLSPAANLQLNATYFQNTAAPAGFNTGYRLEAGLPFSMTDQWIFRPHVEWFYAEPDATVAYFADRLYQTNRVGYFAGLDTYHWGSGIRVRISTFEREVLYTSASQFREQGYLISLGTTFEIF